MTKGFITIATGRDEYYKLAYNLAQTYRYYSQEPLPFALLCDRENNYTQIFDDVLIYESGATNSYLDKLELGNYLPYDETIFIDADCLAYGDLNQLFDYFKDADDVSCFGRVLPLDDQTGWFEYDNLGDLKNQVDYIVGLHGGIYYMKKSDLTKAVFETAKSYIPNYDQYHFKGNFATPGDEPVVALSMAVHHCHPVPQDWHAFVCFWEYVDSMVIDITKPEARIDDMTNESTTLLHWGTRYTRELKYKEQLDLFDLMVSDATNKEKLYSRCRAYYALLAAKEKAQRAGCRVINKLKRTLS